MAALLVAFVLATSAYADGETLYREYVKLGHKPDRKASSRRTSILFRLRDLPDGAGRPWLLEAVPKHRKPRFNIVTFADEARTWRRRSVEASAKRVGEAKRWIKETFRPGGQTNTFAAIEVAFAVDEDLDTIFFLSDGDPTVGDYEYKTGTGHTIYSWNWERQVTIHTVALSLADLFRKTDDWGEKFMKYLARITDGECRIVSRPPE